MQRAARFPFRGMSNTNPQRNPPCIRVPLDLGFSSGGRRRISDASQISLTNHRHTQGSKVLSAIIILRARPPRKKTERTPGEGRGKATPAVCIFQRRNFGAARRSPGTRRDRREKTGTRRRLRPSRGEHLEPLGGP